ncbi:hypothetical protein PtA15_13A486 [Puccinia triticina]|uniref:Uncharacterized protein n=1 Tax=Puccinia triticina TaxID=208348 RepID=A0ABY7D525_9BASI|nr:uncharacterized protein PtA15_13A486 [Puccinia triticina]WAQ91085.1 hypothetical protein PtA15_13A486 [Puccinia triticina]
MIIESRKFVHQTDDGQPEQNHGQQEQQHNLRGLHHCQPGPNLYTVGYFFIGFLITISSSILNAFGNNLQKLDLNKQSKLATSLHLQKSRFRPIWLLELFLYGLSQVMGSILALQYMQSDR